MSSPGRAPAGPASFADEVELALAVVPGRIAPPALAKLLEAVGVHAPDGTPWNGAKLARALAKVPLPNARALRRGDDVIALELLHDAWPDLLTRAYGTGRLARFHAVSSRLFPSPDHSGYAFGYGAAPSSYARHECAMRDLRHALVVDDSSEIARAVLGLSRYDVGEAAYQLVSLMPSSPPATWLARLPGPLVAEAARFAARAAAASLGPRTSTWLAHLDSRHTTDLGGIALLHAAAGAPGDDARAEALLRATGLATGEACLARLLAHDFEGAIAIGEQETTGAKRRRDVFMKQEHAAAYVAACLVAGGPRKVETARAALTSMYADRGAAPVGIAAMITVLRHQAGEAVYSQAWFESSLEVSRGRWASLFYLGLAASWIELPAELSYRLTEALREQAALARTGDYARLADELTAMERRIGTAHPADDARLANRLRTREPWELALDRLEAGVAALELTRGPRDTTRGGGDRVLGWAVYAHATEVSLVPVSRPVRSRGGAPKTESIAKLLTSEAAFVAEHDRRVLAKAKKSRVARRGAEFEIGLAGLLELVGHAHVVDAHGDPVDVVLVEPRLRVRRKASGYVIDFVPPFTREGIGYSLVESGRLEVSVVDEGHGTLASATGPAGLTIPKGAKDRLAQILGSVGAKLRIEGFESANDLVAHAAADARLHVQLFRDGREGLRAALRVAPLGLDGPSIVPGTGASTVVGTRDGRPLRAERDLAAERASVERLREAHPLLAGLPSDGSSFFASDLEGALDFLLALEPLRDDLVIAWPDGDPIKTPSTATRRPIVVRAGAGRDWFRVDGELVLDDAAVVSMQELLAGRARSSGRFVQLDSGQYLALTESLKKQLDALAKTTDREAKQLRMHPLVLHALEGAVGLDVHADPDARARLDAIGRATASTTKPPRGLAAELRDYQREGLRWLAGLGQAGAGAVLADDMGLGKTVQTLALLLHRQKGGPALVVAPTSVAAGWIEQASRFAPTLRFVDFGASDRAAALAQLGPSDVLVVTYGVLTSEVEAFEARRFHTVVFDEAQALKNTATLRTKAARRLDADFRVALSGTPIENHLVELYSILDVVIPGLLGSERDFERRYAAPIRGGDRATLGLLRALVRPFILRRTKAQVLEELPPRTEIVRRIVPGDDERLFYEALRRQAVATVDALADRGLEGRMRVLAEIGRLRRAATDPRLVDPEGPPGAKLAELRELLEEIRSVGHRALVFGQYLDALASVRAELDAAGIAYQYLDGSTPARERAQRVSAFQDGEGDVFLISLKAGGTGLNLTGADYVVLMDPWWNPAVEDQAADRVHRIGQTRAVTIVRLVTMGTIEESILEMHGDKRSLASDVLEGMEAAKKVDLNVLKAMLRG